MLENPPTLFIKYLYFHTWGGGGGGGGWCNGLMFRNYWDQNITVAFRKWQHLFVSLWRVKMSLCPLGPYRCHMSYSRTILPSNHHHIGTILVRYPLSHYFTYFFFPLTNFIHKRVSLMVLKRRPFHKKEKKKEKKKEFWFINIKIILKF